jgi:hypothetical protein
MIEGAGHERRRIVAHAFREAPGVSRAPLIGRTAILTGA